MLGAITIINLIWMLGAFQVEQPKEQAPNQELLSLSEKLLYAVKTDEPVDSLQSALSKYAVNDLVQGLTNDNARKTFWINIYNAYYQILSVREKKTKPKIFTDKVIRFADAAFSLDAVEHGILRKYRWKYSLGYLPQFLPSKSIKQLAVTHIDFRIHFTLNCGAKSCPPIAFYTYDKIETQLELATGSFLESETVIDTPNRTVQVTKIMQWFKGDFKGEKGIRQILSTYLGKDFSTYKIKFREYNWSQDLNNFK